MKSRWHARGGGDQQAPVEMRFIDMFMTALGSLVFLALLLVFLLPKTTHSTAKEEELKRLQEENDQLRKQMQQSPSPQTSSAKTEDKEIILRRFGVFLVTNGCVSTQPELYVRSEAKLVDFKTNQPTPEAVQFDASNTFRKTKLAGDSYFDVGAFSNESTALEPLQKNGLHTKGYFGVSRGADTYSVYVGLSEPGAQDDKGCTVYPFYLASRNITAGDKIILTQRRPYAWLRRFKINVDGTTTLGTGPEADEDFKRDLAEFSKKQSQTLCERKKICDTVDAHYAALVPAPPSPGRASYDRGLAYQGKGEFDRAIAEYNEAIRLDPKYDAAFYNRGRAYKAKGDLDRAIADYNEAIRIETNANRLNNRGIAYADKGDLNRAITDYDEAIQLNPEYDPAYYNRGLAHRAKGDLDRAIADFDKTIQRDAKYAPAYGNRGLAYMDKGDHDSAIADFAEAIKIEPIATRFKNRGLAYVAKGVVYLAIADYNEAIRLDAKYAAAYDSRGQAYRQMTELDRAISDFSEAIRIEPSATRFNNRGQAYFANGDLDRAMNDYNEAIRRDPKYASAYFNRGDVYRAKGDFNRAITEFSEAIRLEPTVAAYDYRARSYFAKGDFEKAIADYNEAIQRDPKYAFAYTNRGRVYLYSGSIAKAQMDFRQATDLNAKSAYAVLWLDLAERRNNLPSRLPQYTASLDMKTWPAPVVRYFLGELPRPQLLAAANDPNPRTKQQQICEANFYSGELALLQGAKEDARALFRLAIEDCPKTFTEWAAANAELKALDAQR